MHPIAMRLWLGRFNKKHAVEYGWPIYVYLRGGGIRNFSIREVCRWLEEMDHTSHREVIAELQRCSNLRGSFHHLYTHIAESLFHTVEDQHE